MGDTPTRQIVECCVCGARAQGAPGAHPGTWTIDPHTSEVVGWGDCRGSRYVFHRPVNPNDPPPEPPWCRTCRTPVTAANAASHRKWCG